MGVVAGFIGRWVATLGISATMALVQMTPMVGAAASMGARAVDAGIELVVDVEDDMGALHSVIPAIPDPGQGSPIDPDTQTLLGEVADEEKEAIKAARALMDAENPEPIMGGPGNEPPDPLARAEYDAGQLVSEDKAFLAEAEAKEASLAASGTATDAEMLEAEFATSDERARMLWDTTDLDAIHQGYDVDAMSPEDFAQDLSTGAAEDLSGGADDTSDDDNGGGSDDDDGDVSDS